jgi:transcriptional regulator of arginine metabolism
MTTEPKPTLDQAILLLIERREIPDQATLIQMLEDQGYRTSQGAISRRLARLSVQKREGHYRRVVPENHPHPPYQIIESPPNLILLRTGPSYGMTLAIRIDRNEVPGVAGTVAGEDTLLVVLRPEAAIEDVRQALVQLLGPAG